MFKKKDTRQEALSVLIVTSVITFLLFFCGSIGIFFTKIFLILILFILLEKFINPSKK
jgi:hypothetical protein